MFEGYRQTLAIFSLSLVFAFSAKAIVGAVEFDPSTKNLDEQKIASHTVVLLNTQNAGTHSRCTATLLSPHVALTAAHCIPTELSELWIVTSPFEFAVAERHAVLRATVHPEYHFQSAQNSDLAVVLFSGDLNSNYRPTTVVENYQTVLSRFWLYSAGYGESSESKEDAGTLRIGQVVVFDFDVRSAVLRMDQTGGAGICKGDSGGPAFVRSGNDFQVLAVASAVLGQTPQGQPAKDLCTGVSFFNSTSYYKKWIEQSVGQLEKMSSARP